jgi:hypothetical protein
MARAGLVTRFHRGLLALGLLLSVFAPDAFAGSVRMGWNANPEPDIAGYVLAWGTSTGVYGSSVTVAPDVTTQEVTGLADGTYYFVVRAFNSAGLHSGNSTEVSVVIRSSVTSPTVSGPSPGAGPTTGGTDVVVTGTGFQPGAIVRFGATAGTVLQLTATSVTVRTPAGTPGTVPISVTNPDGGTGTRSSAFTYLAPPSIGGLSPTVGPTAGGTDVVISGTGFQTGAAVRFGATAGTVLQLTATSLTARTPAGTIGTVSVSVTNPDGGTVTRSSAFTYQDPLLPTVTSWSPNRGSVSGGTDVTINGMKFQSGVVVRFGTYAAAVLSVTASKIVARTAPAIAPGLVSMSVVNPDGNGVTIPDAFTYRGSTPSVSSTKPKKGSADGGTTLTLDGAYFEADTTVSVNGKPATVLSATKNRLTVRMPPHVPAVVTIMVINPDAQVAVVPDAFVYEGGAPTISSIAPQHGAVEGGSAVVVSGTNFTSGGTVLFDGQPAAVTAMSSTAMTVIAPAHASGAVNVVVRNADGQSATAANAFTYDAATPRITTITPSSGPIDGGTTVTITGVRLGAGPKVTFGGVAARLLSSTPTTLTVETPQHAAGVVDVEVSLANRLGAVAPAGFTYDDPSKSETFARYFAEGASGGFFRTRFALANPHAEPVPVTVTFTDTQGTPTTMTLTVPATSRATIDESNRPALASEAFATKFEAPKVIGVERTMAWATGGPPYGAHSDVGVTEPRTSWVLAEGATIGGFNTFYLLQNPTTETAQVKVDYLLATGQRIEKIHAVAPQSRTNIWVNMDDPALEAAEMSASFTSLNAVPVVVERSMYRNNGSELFSAGHNSAAVDAPALRWFLAEGATGGTFDEFVLIANPNATEATLRVNYLRAGASPIVKTYTASAQSRLTLWVDQEAPELASAEVSVIVESLTATPVVVERSMWWRATPEGEWIESHNGRGVTSTAARWLVADGASGGTGDASTYVLVANTASVEAPVRFTLLTESGLTRSVQDIVTANGRYSMDVAATFPEARGTRFSVLVESVTGMASLVVERSSYSSTLTTTWAAGTNSLGVPLP